MGKRISVTEARFFTMASGLIPTTTTETVLAPFDCAAAERQISVSQAWRRCVWDDTGG